MRTRIFSQVKNAAEKAEAETTQRFVAFFEREQIFRQETGLPPMPESERGYWLKNHPFAPRPSPFERSNG